MDSHFYLPKKWPTDSRFRCENITSLIEVWFGFRKPHFLGRPRPNPNRKIRSWPFFFTGKTRVVGRFFKGGNDLNWLVIWRGFWGYLNWTVLAALHVFLFVCIWVCNVCGDFMWMYILCHVLSLSVRFLFDRANFAIEFSRRKLSLRLVYVGCCTSWPKDIDMALYDTVWYCWWTKSCTSWGW